MSEAIETADTIDRRVTAEGEEITLLGRGAEFEILVDGRPLAASDARRSERSLVELTLAPLAQRNDITVLLAGLGMGHTLRALLDAPGVTRVDVVEISDAIVDWNRQHFAPHNGDALSDARVHVHVGDLLGHLKRLRYEQPEAIPQEIRAGWLAMVVDVDAGTAALSRPANAALYSDEGLGRLEGALRHGGVLGMWSAERELELLRRLSARFVNVAEMMVPVEIGERTNLDYVYRGRRAPDRAVARHIAQA